MSDREFVYEYLNKNYSIFIDGYGLMFKDEKINQSFNADSFKINYFKIIGNWESDEGINSFSFVKDWYEEKKSTLIKDLNEYLNDCEFILGNADWIVQKKDGTVIELNDLIERFDPIYSKEFITHFYGDWYSERVCEYSEKIMSQW